MNFFPSGNRFTSQKYQNLRFYNYNLLERYNFYNFNFLDF
jgi:hypothetical protein